MMKRYLIPAFAVLLVLLALHAGGDVFAQVDIEDSLEDSPGASLTIQRVYDIVMNFACWLARVAIIIIVIAFIFYGFMFFWSQGSPEAFSAAKNAFRWGLVGALVILATYTIIVSIAAFIYQGSSYDFTLILEPFNNCSSFGL